MPRLSFPRLPLLARFLAGELIQTSLLVLAGLLALFSFFDLIGSVDRVGQGDLTWGRLLWYTALTLPGHAYELLPVAVLIGSLAALSQLVANSEFTVIRASGLSLWRTMAYLGLAGVFFALLTLLLGEWLAPHSEQKARQVWLSALKANLTAQTESGFWLKEGRNIVNSRYILPDGSLQDVRIFRFDAGQRLLGLDLAERASHVRGELWRLQMVRRIRYQAGRVSNEQVATLDWPSQLSPDVLQVFMVVPEQLSAANLSRYIRHLQANGQQTARYQIALWAKLLYPLACLAMVLIALPFANTSRRSGGVGLKLFIGMMLGLGFHFASKLFAHLGQLYGWPPLFAAATPLAVFVLFAAGLLYRQERR